VTTVVVAKGINFYNDKTNADLLAPQYIWTSDVPNTFYINNTSVFGSELIISTSPSGA
jgi:hypothetical protein